MAGRFRVSKWIVGLTLSRIRQRQTDLDQSRDRAGLYRQSDVIAQERLVAFRTARNYQ
jgi:hypothetical protein